MLTPEEQAAVQNLLEHAETPRSACIEALKIVQRSRRWISAESIRDLAAALGMSAGELDNVATFYNLIYRQPVGEHVILLCDSISCWIMGYEKIRSRLNERLGIDLGETTPDDRFTFLPMVCLGACDHAPAMMVGEQLYTDLDDGALDRILAEYET